MIIVTERVLAVAVEVIIVIALVVAAAVEI